MAAVITDLNHRDDVTGLDRIDSNNGAIKSNVLLDEGRIAIGIGARFGDGFFIDWIVKRILTPIPLVSLFEQQTDESGAFCIGAGKCALA